jgi:hypothetical protein
LGTKAEASIYDIAKAGGEFNSEARYTTKDLDSSERKDYSKEVKELFRAVEGNFPVVAIDVRQLQTAVDYSTIETNFRAGSFYRGRRILTQSISFQTLPQILQDKPISPFKSEVERRLEALEKEIVEVDVKRYFIGFGQVSAAAPPGLIFPKVGLNPMAPGYWEYEFALPPEAEGWRYTQGWIVYSQDADFAGVETNLNKLQMNFLGVGARNGRLVLSATTVPANKMFVITIAGMRKKN